jgi:surface antigen
VIGTNDYPWPHAGTGFDTWGYEFRNCTSFCAWRISNDLRLKVPLWGSGGEWGAKARAQGVLVDGHPRPHDLACFLPNQNGAGPKGHIAFVTRLTLGTVDLEEYNFDRPLAYGQRFGVNPSGLLFIHYATTPLPPAPSSPGGPPMWLYQATNGTVYLVAGNTLVPLGAPADIHVFTSKGAPVITQASLTAAAQAEIAKLPKVS